PALPKAWGKGKFTGLRARGGFEVDAAWSSGRLTSATVRSTLGGPCRLRVPARPAARLAVRQGEKPIHVQRPGERLLVFETAPGGVYSIVAPPFPPGDGRGEGG